MGVIVLRVLVAWTVLSVMVSLAVGRWLGGLSLRSNLDAGPPRSDP